MKKLFPFFSALLLLCAEAYHATAQEFRDTIVKEFLIKDTSKYTALGIYNMNGTINVEGYAGQKIIIHVRKTITANSNPELEKLKKQYKLSIVQQKDSVIAYISEPFDSRPYVVQKPVDNKLLSAAFFLDYTVKVPFGSNIDIFTMGGRVNVRDIYGSLQLRNVTGDIFATGVKGPTVVGTTTGNILVDYLSNPPDYSTYTTVNGNIDVTYREGLSANVNFTTFTGELTSDFGRGSDKEKTPVKENSMAALTGKKLAFQVGKGEKRELSFFTMNGNVFMRRK